MKIALLSDLHIGETAREPDFQPGVGNLDDPNSYLNRFRNFIDKEDLVADYLVITGDITNKATFEEYTLASEIVSKIAEMLSIPEGHILFTLGNHDRNWEMISAFDKAPIEKQAEAPYEPFISNEFFNNLHADLPQAFYRKPFYCIWEFEELVLVSFNSAINDSPDDRPHYGCIDQDTIDELENELNAKALDNKVLIFITHHHPYQYSEPLSKYYPDFSIMQNGGGLLELLWKHRFDFVFHGHKHFPKFQIVSDELDWPIVMICAGTFSATINSKFNGIVTNQFHLLEISEKPPASEKCKGMLTSWKYLFHWGWIASDRWGGISHKHAFGNDFDEQSLLQCLEDAIGEVFSSESYARWSILQNTQDSLRFMPEKKVYMLLNSLKEKCGFEIQKTDDDIMLLKAST